MKGCPLFFAIRSGYSAQLAVVRRCHCDNMISLRGDMKMLFKEDVQKYHVVDCNQRVNLLDRFRYIEECRSLRASNRPQKLTKTQEIGICVVAISIVIFLVMEVLYNLVYSESELFLKIMSIIATEAVYIFAFILSFMQCRNKILKSTVHDPARNIVSMIIFGLAIICLVPVMMIFHSDHGLYIFGFPMVYFLSSFLFVATERLRLYPRKVEARCVGYTRRIARLRRLGRFCILSPIFEYEINGETYTAIYDREVWAWNSNIELDSVVKIDLHKDDPTRVLSPSKIHAIHMFALAAFYVFVFLFGLSKRGFTLF